MNNIQLNLGITRLGALTVITLHPEALSYYKFDHYEIDIENQKTDKVRGKKNNETMRVGLASIIYLLLVLFQGLDCYCTMPQLHLLYY